MKAQQWQRIDKLFQAALALDPSDRASFLDHACKGDAALRHEVESLINSHDSAGSFISSPAIEANPSLIASDIDDSILQKQIGPYLILSRIGAGGMGEVYLAQDARLGRKVALKVLPSYFTTDEQRVRRFQQEARAASALNHPNIVTIYDIGETDGRHFIAMEHIEGETLRERIYRDKAPLEKLLKYLKQVAEGLTKAHAAGIIHRDLKPDNIMITRDGYAKVLDFGLAKLVEQPKVTGNDEANSSGVETALMPQNSLSGMVMGTVGYMSPEQAQGRVKEIDHRSDIFTFGCILYEAATGQKAFDGKNALDSLNKIVNAPTPQVRAVNSHAPEDLQRILLRCLAKDPDQRYNSIKEVAIELEGLQQELVAETQAKGRSEAFSTNDAQSATGTIQVIPASLSASAEARQTSSAEYLIGEIKRHKRGFVLAFAVGLIAVASLGLALFELLSQNQSAQSGTLLKVTPLASATGVERSVAFSPDGKQIAYVWTGERNDNFDIYLKLIGVGEPLRLTTNPMRDMSPRFSPDGRYIAFLRGFHSDSEDRGFYLIPALGGAERKLSDAYGSPGPGIMSQVLDWSPDGRTLAVVDKTSEDEPWGIFLLSIETRERRKLTEARSGYNGDVLVAFSPDGSHVAFARTHDFVGDIYSIPITGGEPVRLTEDDATIYGLAWTPDSASLVFSSERGGTSSALWRVPAAGGTPTLITGSGENPRELAIARQGDRLAYAQTTADTNIYRIELTDAGVGRRSEGSPASFISSTRQEGEAEYSPDGRRVVYRSNRSGAMEIWVSDNEGKNAVQLTNFGKNLTQQTSFGGPRAISPKWSPDGRFVAFDSTASGNADIYVVSADGGSPRRLTTDPSGEIAPSWSRDGRFVYFASNRTGRSEVWKMPAAGGDAVQLTHGGGVYPAASPDGRIVYYVKGLNEPGLWQVSAEGGEETPLFEEKIAKGDWAVTQRGIYFFTWDPRASKITYKLGFFDFATHRTTPVTTLEGPRPAASLILGLSVSPDERFILYTQRDQLEFDLMLVENFK